MGLQDFVDRMNAEMQRGRAETQMTLGKMIDALEALPSDMEMEGLTFPHSYRGYYCDLAFERTGAKMKGAEIKALCMSAMGRIFEGYKGGDYLMGELTPVWIAAYGSSANARRIMAINPDGTIETSEKDEDD